MAHEKNIVHPDGPNAPHAFDMVSLKPRNGALDAHCPVCHGYGEWNCEIDLVSFRCKREPCDRCHGAGWVETGHDPISLPDIELSADGSPKWVTRIIPQQDASDEEISRDGPLAS